MIRKGLPNINSKSIFSSGGRKNNNASSLLLEKIRKGEVDSGSVETAQDFEDKANAELAEFTPSSRRTGWIYSVKLSFQLDYKPV